MNLMTFCLIAENSGYMKQTWNKWHHLNQCNLFCFVLGLDFTCEQCSPSNWFIEGSYQLSFAGWSLFMDLFLFLLGIYNGIEVHTVYWPWVNLPFLKKSFNALLPGKMHHHPKKWNHICYYWNKNEARNDENKRIPSLIHDLGLHVKDQRRCPKLQCPPVHCWRREGSISIERHQHQTCLLIQEEFVYATPAQKRGQEQYKV